MVLASADDASITDTSSLTLHYATVIAYIRQLCSLECPAEKPCLPVWQKLKLCSKQGTLIGSEQLE